MENLCYPEILFDQEEYVALFQEIPNIKSLIDIGHAWIKKWDFERLFRDMGEKIDAFHIDDNDGISDLHVKMGEGNLDQDAFYSAYQKYCPGTRLVIEYLGVPTKEIEESAAQIRKRATE